MKRTKFPNRKPPNIILATAKPNKIYRWHNSIKDIILQAKLINNRVMFYELWNGSIKCLPENFIKSLFPKNTLIKDRPFTEKGNKDFYAVLHRNQIKYRQKFNEIKNQNDQKQSL